MNENQSGHLILTWGILSLVGILLVLGGGWMYQRQLERTQTLSMQAMLINVVIAQDLYQAKQHRLADKWSEIVRDIDRPASLEVQMQANAQQPTEYFMGFGKKAENRHNGYDVTLSVEADGQNGMLTARRVGSWLFSYQLQRALPDGKTQCDGKGLAKLICHDFEQTSRNLEIENLIPVPDADAASLKK